MFLTFCDVENGKPLYLEQPIDNCCENLTIALRSITFFYNIYNVFEGDYVRDGQRTRRLTPGLYNFDELSESLNPLDLNVDEKNGIVSVRVPEGSTVSLSQNLTKMLGLDDEQPLTTGTYTGDRHVNVTPTKVLLVHCNELNTSENKLNGRESDVLGILPVQNAAFGELITVKFLEPHRKKMRGGSISKLQIDIRNEAGASVLSKSPYTLVLETQ